MKALYFLPLLLLAPLFRSTAAPAATPEPVPAAPAPLVHCQVPCGIYGDKMRIDMMREDVATIEKAMGQITELSATDDPNQVVRWVMAKDEHAQHLQDLISSYWLAQRIKVPEDPNHPGHRAKYLGMIEQMHLMNVHAMKCKQTTDLAHVTRLKELVELFDTVYFDDHDPEHEHLGDHK